MALRTRLTLVSGGLMAALVVAMGTFLYLQLRADLRETVDTGLRSRAEVLLERAEAGLPQGAGLVEPEDAFAQVLSADGRVLESLAAGLVVANVVRGPPLAERLAAG